MSAANQASPVEPENGVGDFRSSESAAQSRGWHRVIITARRFKLLRWPAVKTEWIKYDECGAVESYAQTMRDMGARVIVVHTDHRPSWAHEVDSDA